MLYLAVALLAFPLIAQSEQREPEDEPFATIQIEGWHAEAQTYWARGRANLPIVSNIACRLETNGLSLVLVRTGEVSIQPDGISRVDEDGAEQRFGTLNVRTLRINGVKYAAKAVSTADLPWRFIDVTYPREEGDDIILPVFRGYLAVSRGPDGPWLPMSSLLDQLIAYDEIDIGYLDPSAEDLEPRILHRHVRLTGLGPALRWCETQFTSDRAYRIAP